MLGTLLGALKIIGYALAGLAGLVLVLSLLILFAKLRYEFTASDTQASFRLSWLCGFLRIRRDGGKTVAHWFWFMRINSKKAVTKKKAAKKKPKKKRDMPGGSSLRDMLAAPRKADLLRQVLLLVSRLFRAVKPRRFSLWLRFGFDDPSHTGYLLGVLGIIQGVTGLDMSVDGDFCAASLSYNLYVKDSLRLWALTWPLAAFCARKPARTLIINYMKKGDVNEPSA